MGYIDHILIQCGLFIILALSLNLINGYCGQFSLGHAGFWAIGAYCSAVYSVFSPLPLSHTMNLGIAAGIGFLSSAFFGLLLGGVCLRLRGDYLAIATLGFGEIVRNTLINIDFVGGSRGLTDIPRWANLYHVYFVVVLVVFFMLRLKFSAHGRAIIAIREDEIAAENMGVNLYRYKLFAFIVGAGIAGIAGALWSHTQQFISPVDFTFMQSVMILVMIILGGLGSVTGSIVGAIIIVTLPQILSFAGHDISQYRMVIFALMLILLMLWRPSGIFGSYEIFEKRLLLRRSQKI